MLMPSSPLNGMLRSRGIQKKKRGLVGGELVGRRVLVPQRYTEVEDDGDGFCFGAVVMQQTPGRAMLKFDYTGEVEAWSVALVRSWLADEGVDDLSSALEAL